VLEEAAAFYPQQLDRYPGALDYLTSSIVSSDAPENFIVFYISPVAPLESFVKSELNKES
jgi:hypothetical protein